jgi:hypothetical protein
MVSVMAASAGMAGNVSPCPVGTVPIQIMPQKYGDPRNDPDTMPFKDHLMYFRAFVTAVTEHVTTRLSGNRLCLDSAEGRNRSLLQFVYWPLFMEDENSVPEPLSDSSGCRISSPWMELVVGRDPVPSIRGIVYWNERQLLADQAVLEGSRNVPPGMATPLRQGNLIRYLERYEGAKRYYPGSFLVDKLMYAATKKRVPPDRKSWREWSKEHVHPDHKLWMEWLERRLSPDQMSWIDERMPQDHKSWVSWIEKRLSPGRKLWRAWVEGDAPPDIVWLFHRSGLPEGAVEMVITTFKQRVRAAMGHAIHKGAEGYTKLVTTLIDRCLASNGAGVAFRYNSILDISDPVLRKQYRIDMPPLR